MKILYGKVKKRIGQILTVLCQYKGIELLEGHEMPDHIHRGISVPPKYSIAMTVGYLKGKSAIRIQREILKVTKGFTNKSFWTREYCVSTVGLNEKQIREYIKNQEDPDQGRQGLLNLDGPEIN
jgi:putative transposase